MGIVKVEKNKKNLKILINGWDELMIWACIDGEVREIYTDGSENPRSAQFIVGDFCFFAGIPNMELIENIKNSNRNYSIMTANNDAWHKLFEKCNFNECKIIKRYAIKKEKGVFNRQKLEKLVKTLDSKYKIKLIDYNLYNEVMKENWSRDLCSNFLDAKDYLKRGFGVVILDGENIVSGASSYVVYEKAIEIEVDTKKEYRKKGLATSASAKLILECLDRGIYPSWDAANLWSVALAEKLGYHFSHEYICYEVRW